MKIEIGERKLSSIAEEEVLQVAIIEECIASPDYWNPPTIIEFDNTMFTNSVILEYKSTRKSDGIESSPITFYFKHEMFSFHYHSSRRDRSHSKRFGFDTIRYLIKQGFYLPLSNIE